jgi:hypothetical protein
MEIFKQAVAKQIQEDLRAVFKSPEATRAQIYEAVMARLKSLMPDPEIEVTVDEEASNASPGSVVVNVRGDFPHSLVQAWREAGIEVRTAPFPPGWTLTDMETMEWQLHGPDRAVFRIPRSNATRAQVVTICWRIHEILYPE